jgi:hypothetical protein
MTVYLACHFERMREIFLHLTQRFVQTEPLPSAEVAISVIPAHAGIQVLSSRRRLDTRFRAYDVN